MSTATISTRSSAAARDDYNVRNYAYHIYFAYCVLLYSLMAVMNFVRPSVMLASFYAIEDLGVGGAYYARQSAALMMAMAVFTFFGWQSKSGPVRDLLIKTHFAHHLFSLLADWYSEYHGVVVKHWQQGMFSPNPFFTFLILFLWMSDKSRNLDAEERENLGKND